MQTSFKSNLQNTTDFQMLFYGIQAALTEKDGWTNGLTKLYNTASQDLLYKNPMGQVLFLDNHDISRFFSVVDKNVPKYKMALGWLLTFRGVPQLYYGDEILMEGFSNPDGLVRADFLGGWTNDSINKFLTTGRTVQENEVFEYVKKLANFRLTSTAITTGKLMQYTPQNGLYTYFRYNKEQTVICIMNTSNEDKTVDVTNQYSDRADGFSKIRNVITDNVSAMYLNVKAGEMYIGSLQK